MIPWFKAFQMVRQNVNIFSAAESLNFSHSILNVSDSFCIEKCDIFLTGKYFLPCFQTFVIFCESTLKISFR